MKQVLLLLIVVFFSLQLHAQLIWGRNYGGSGHEYCIKTIKTLDGGFAFVGYTASNDHDVTGNHGGDDLWVAKTTASGTITWSKVYGGTQADQGFDMIETSDGFLVVGHTSSSDGDVTGHHGTLANPDVWVLKLNSSGSLVWNKCYGGTSEDRGKSIVTGPSGDYYVAGTTLSNNGDVTGNHGTLTADYWLIRITAAGSLVNQVCLGGTGSEEAYCLAATADGGCIIGGRASSTDLSSIGYHAGADMYLAKLNATLAIDWQKCYGGSGTEECNSILQLSDGSYAALGYTSSYENGDITGHHGAQGTDDFWLLKLNSNGSLNWAKCYGGDSDDQANGLTQTLDGGFAMCGLTASTNGDVSGGHAVGMLGPDIWVAKVSGSGVLQAQLCAGGTDQDESFNIFEISANTFIVTGFTYSVNYDVTANYGSADGWIIEVTPLAVGIKEASNTSHLQLGSNPVQNFLLISGCEGKTYQTSITDITGRNLYSNHLQAEGRELKINVSTLQQGMYWIRVTGEKQDWVAPFLKY